MSAEEMREYCKSLCSFKVRVEIRLKNGQDILVGRINDVEAERFQLVSENDVVQNLRYAWVARIKNA